MQIVIDIPKDLYEECTKLGDSSDILFEAIRNGKILPEGHGRLIDADELKKVYDERITYLYKLNKKDNPSRESRICATNWCNNMIDELPTVIEAERNEV